MVGARANLRCPDKSNFNRHVTWIWLPHGDTRNEPRAQQQVLKWWPDLDRNNSHLSGPPRNRLRSPPDRLSSQHPGSVGGGAGTWVAAFPSTWWVVDFVLDKTVGAVEPEVEGVRLPRPRRRWMGCVVFHEHTDSCARVRYTANVRDSGLTSRELHQSPLQRSARYMCRLQPTFEKDTMDTSWRSCWAARVWAIPRSGPLTPQTPCSSRPRGPGAPAAWRTVS